MKLLLLAAALLLLGCTLLFLRGSEVTATDALAGVPLPTVIPPATADASAESSGDGETSRTSLMSERPPVEGVRGRIVSQQSERPLRAWVRAGASSVCSDASTGSFTLVLCDAASSLRITAANHEALELPLSGGAPGAHWIDLGSIALAPLTTTSFRVVSARGTPQAGASVQALATPLPGHEPTPEIALGTANASGELCVALDRPLLVGASWEGAAAQPVLVRPEDEQVTLWLEGPSARFGLREARTQAPVAGAEVQLTRIDVAQPFVLERESGADGLLTTPVSMGTYRVKPESGLVLAPGPQLLPGPSGTSVCVASLGAHDDVWIDVNAQPARRFVRTMDARTRSPVGPASGWLASWEDHPSLEKPGLFRLSELLSAEDGTSDLCLDGLGTLAPDPTLTLFAVAPGFAPGRIDDPGASITPGTTVELFLEPLALKRLRISDDEGRPFLHHIEVRDQTGARLIAGTPTLEGRIGPFGWEAGDVILASSWQSNAGVLAVVEEEELRQGEEIGVIAAGLARLAVSGLPEREVELLCYDERGFRSAGVRRGSSLFFEQLVPGAYEVGSVHDFRTLDLRIAQGLPALPMTLAAGDSAAFTWDERWMPSEVIAGRVDVVGVSPESLCVVPQSCPVGMRPLSGSSWTRHAVSAAGEYRIEDFPNVVTRLEFALEDPIGRLVPLAVCQVGETPLIECGRLVVDCTSAFSEEEILVEYRPVLPGLEVRETFVSGRRGPGLLDLGPLSVDVEAVVVRGAEWKKAFAIALKPGETTTIVL